MPTTTFFNLAEAKQALIIDAALAEFSTHNVDQASVANIVRDSQIARGSFYKYFADLDDLYYYVYNHVTQQAHGSVLQAIQEAEGDLFLGIETYLKELAHVYSDDKYHDYFKMVTLNLNYVTQVKISHHPTRQQLETPLADFTSLVNTAPLKIEQPHELSSFFKVLVPVIHDCLSDYFANNWSEAQLLADYRQRIHWLQHGILKDDLT